MIASGRCPWPMARPGRKYVMLLALRFFGTIAGGLLGWRLGLLLSVPQGAEDPLLIVLLIALGAALGAVLAPFLTLYPIQWTRQQIEGVPATDLLAAAIGLIIGLIIAALLVLPLSMLPPPFSQFLPVLAAAVFGYLGVAVMVAHKQELLTFARRGQAIARPAAAPSAALLDTSAIIDGRVADVCQTGFLEGEILVPRFVLEELQHIADSSDVLRRNRGRRGLEILNRLQKDAATPVRVIEEVSAEGEAVDAGLIRLAREHHHAIITTDYNLNRVAELQGVRVLNVNELATAVRPVVLPGEEMVVRVVQEGKEAGQGVAYLDDGTMVVVDQGRKAVGSERRVVVTRVLQTVAGRMIFASLREGEPAAPRARNAERG
jgi:uncharacterized protein YacL